VANFKTHLGVAAAGSGLLASACLGAGIAGPPEMVGLAIAGTVGGLLPDIDSDGSTPIKAMFTGLGLIAAALMVFDASAHASILELWLVAAITYSSVRYVVAELFRRFTVHRGVFHSLAAGLLFWCLTAAIASRWFSVGDRLAWATGSFLFFGYLVHLALDEMFSVDLMNSRVKRSFGTALKLVDYSNWRTSTVLCVAMLASLAITPDPKPFFDVLKDARTYERIAARFLVGKPAGWSQSAQSPR
jgi:hypothetical protein